MMRAIAGSFPGSVELVCMGQLFSVQIPWYGHPGNIPSAAKTRIHPGD
jgi:hypothetical protein